MDRDELKQKLTQPFNPDQWKEVVETVFISSQFYAQARTIPSSEEMVEQIADKGTVRISDGEISKSIALVEIRLKPGSVHLHKNRVKLRSLVAKLIDQERAHGVIAVFEQGSGDYRLSFVAREAVLEDGEFKVRETPAKRFTYLLGPGETCRTAAERLYALSQKPELSLDDVTDAFSVERLNREFYKKIRHHFYKLVGGKVENQAYKCCMELPGLPNDKNQHHTAYSEFAVRLLGRIVFCWFLKHKRCDQNKPLIHNDLLSSDAVNANENYYHTVLEKLFFQTLNTPRLERNEYAPKHAHLVPFLNGGLFDPQNGFDEFSGDYYRPRWDGMSANTDKLIIPDDWFRDLFQTLEMYNFTIDENTALDAEVSIDPEILGRIFENLLAEINPETGDSARKATGSFYTPRRIVDYMVEESLLQHLKTALGIDASVAAGADRGLESGADILVCASPEPAPSQSAIGTHQSEIETRLRALFVDDDQPHNLDDETRREVVDTFRTIKVLDPACGSGAFPVGILQKMLCALRKVDPENDYWLDAQVQQIHEMKLTKPEVDKRVDNLISAFETNTHDYWRKLYIIQNSVYGVDIQPIATEISKLRFFLTLIVDEEVDDNDPDGNRGILPLPNLDFKFVCANTLIPAPELENHALELNLDYYPEFFSDFSQVAKLYFYARNPKEKELTKQQLLECVNRKIGVELDKIQELQGSDLFEHAKMTKAQKKKRDKLTQGKRLWNSYKNIFTGQPAGFFDPRYMFPDAGDGFDVVIANPPYVRQEDIKEYKPTFSEVYDCYKGTADLLVYFYEKGCRLLKENGVLTYITSNKYFRAGYGDKLRGYLSDTMRIHQLIDFGDAPVFDATAYPSIIVMSKVDQASRLIESKRDAYSTFLALNWTPGDPVSAFVRIFQERAFPMAQSYLTSEGWKLEHPHIFELMQKLCNAGTPLGEYVDGKFYRGILTGFNEAFVIDRLTRDRLIAEDPSCDAIIKPFLRGRDVKRWRINPQDLWLIFTRRGIDIDAYPSVKKHLQQYREKLEPKPKNWKPKTNEKWQGRKAGSYEWYEIQDNIAYWKEFEKPKILYQEISTFHVFAWDAENYFTNNKCFLIPGATQFLLGVLNCPSSWWFIGNMVTKLNGGAFEMRAPCMAQIPIPSATSEQQAEIEERVEKILAQKNENPEADVSALEAEIDRLVYKLYDLTDEEIRIIDPDYQPMFTAPPAEDVDEGRWVLSMLSYLYTAEDDLVAMDEMTMAQILILDDDLRGCILKGGKRKAIASHKRVPNVDQLWKKYSNAQFNLAETPTETAVGLGPSARSQSEVEQNAIGRKFILKAQEAHSAIRKINETCKTPEERFEILETVYEPAGTV